MITPYQRAMKKVNKMDLVKVHILAMDAGKKLPEEEKKIIIENRMIGRRARRYITDIEMAAIRNLLTNDPGGLIDIWYLC